MRYRPIVYILILLTPALISAQEISVSGVVTSADDGVPVPGANIIVKGSGNGTSTDFDGNYSLENVPDNATLVVSALGFVSQEVPVAGKSQINVVLEVSTEQLEEVVVTAFGLEREEKSITYAAQAVNSEGMKEAPPLNITSGLSGKVAGISVTQGASGVGSPTRVVLRGNRSIAGSSQPLYVVDGVPLGGDISNLSPYDIESISVLRGPNAAALYGNRANNGAIVITTKSGNGIEGTTVSVVTSLMTSSPNILWDYQNKYGQGIDGTYSPSSVTSWGPEMTGQTVDHWSNDPNGPTSYAFNAQPDNVKDFYNTGYEFNTNFSIANTTGNGSKFLSYTFTDAEGVVPNNALKRHNLLVRGTQTVFDKLTVDAKLNYIRSDFDNQVYGGDNFANPNRHALRLPRNIRTGDIRQFEFFAEDGSTDQHFWKPGDNGGANPYWTANRNNNEILNERVLGLLSLKYQVTDELSILARSAIDRTNFYREDKWHNDSYIIAQNGMYAVEDQVSTEWNSDVLVNYKNQFGDFSVDLSAGANLRTEKLQGNRTAANTTSGLNIENLFSLTNIASPILEETFAEKEVQSAYAFGQIGYKEFLYLDASFRNDWSSTLPKANRSFNYPSVGLTAIISDMVKMPDFMNFAKLRFNYAKVGGDTDPYMLSRVLELIPGGSSGVFDPSSTLPIENLLPEETTSTEIGADLRFFNNRIGLNITYYKSNSINQLFTTPVPVASGFSAVFQNGGDIQNKGIELVLTGTPVLTDDFKWDITFNFSKNESEVLKITEGFDEIGLPSGPPFWGRVVAEVGKPFGEFYSRGFERDGNGNVIVDGNGLPMITGGTTVSLGNFNPDWLGGISNEFSYKNLKLSFLIDIRQGGVVSSFTEAVLAGDGLITTTLPGREGGVFGQDIFPGETAVTQDGQPNNIQTTAQAVYSAVGGRNTPVGEAFVRDASNARLRELSLKYSFSEKILERLPVKSLDVALVGRNLFFLWNKAKYFDPEAFPTTGSGQSGFNSFATPTSRNVGVNIKFTF
ncbi:SusC/RagA family TonB-linked outer membrane protein [Sinomicrobium weinanense]|uniref:SusC/RagA family TonB-linked outer membrane protein n=1 Tax=Sinomicrobium weinanense TaxID=2842200 RepID=A0A926JP82_9FLAO|nr:SusC/RagA family TonB-linked outer membrane protein [Sinomicrobium weinanense]MBC9794938.1 SusC/RagA family TonB-linked outer membrane protein [Sinomicrobium weinanense]MBU3125709.1 SusC/RagA family TonB-linked outer membrane protein [Sinomicrobium weinanense]